MAVREAREAYKARLAQKRRDRVVREVQGQRRAEAAKAEAEAAVAREQELRRTRDRERKQAWRARRKDGITGVAA